MPNVHDDPFVLATTSVGDAGQVTELVPFDAVSVMSPPFSAAVTLTVGVVSLVMSSVRLTPVSDEIVRSGVAGAGGAVVSLPSAETPTPCKYGYPSFFDGSMVQIPVEGVKSHPTNVACSFRSEVDLPLAPQDAEVSLVIVESQ